MKQKNLSSFWKRSLCKGLSLAMAVTMIPSVGTQAAPLARNGEPTDILSAGSILTASDKTTKEQPFTLQTGSANFSSPAFIVRQVVEGEREDNTGTHIVRPTDQNTGVTNAQQTDLLIAAAEAKYNTTADGGGQDVMVSVSSDGGATWKYSFPFYFPDSAGNGVEGAVSVCNPVLADAEKLNVPDTVTGGNVAPGFVVGGTTYLFANVYPGGVAVSSDSRFEAPKAGSGYITVGSGDNATKRLALTSDLDKTNTNPTTQNAGYEYYVGDFDNDTKRAKVLKIADNSESDYQVDEWYNLYKKSDGGSDYQPITQQRLDSVSGETPATQIQQNVFYKDSELHVYKTGYLMCVTSEDNGNAWSNPEILNPTLYETEDVLYTLESGKGLYTTGKRIVIPATVSKNNAEAATMLWKCKTDESHGWHHADVPALASTADNQETWSRGGEIVELSRGSLRMFLRTGKSNVYYADAARGLTEEEGESDQNADMFAFTDPVSTASSVTTDSKITAINYSRQVNPGSDNAGNVILAAMPTGTGHTNGLLLTFKKTGGTVKNPAIARHGNGFSLYNGNFAAASLDEMYYGSKIGMVWEHGIGKITFETYQTLDVLDHDLYVPNLEYDLELRPDDSPYTRSYQVTGQANLEPSDRNWSEAGGSAVTVTFDPGTATTKEVPALYSISTHNDSAKTLGNTFGQNPDALANIENAEFIFTKPFENADNYIIYSEGAQRYLTNYGNSETFFTTTIRNNMKVEYNENQNKGRGTGWMICKDNNQRVILFAPGTWNRFDSNTSLNDLNGGANNAWTMHLQLLKKLTAAELAAMTDKSAVIDFTGETGDEYKYIALGKGDTIESGRKYLIGYKMDADSSDTRFPEGGYVVLYPKNRRINYGKLIYGTRTADIAAQKTLTISPKAETTDPYDLTVNNITYHITVKYKTLQINKNGSIFIEDAALKDVNLGDTAIVTPQAAKEEKKVFFDYQNAANRNLNGYSETPNENVNVENAEFMFTKTGQTDDGRTTWHIYNEMERKYLVNQNAANDLYKDNPVAMATEPKTEKDGGASFEIRRYDPNNTEKEDYKDRYMYFWYNEMRMDGLGAKGLNKASWENQGDFNFELLTKKANGVESYQDPIPGYERAETIESGKSYLITEFFEDEKRGKAVIVLYPRDGVANRTKLCASTETDGVRLTAIGNEGDTANIRIGDTTYRIEITGECLHEGYGSTITTKKATCLEEGYEGRIICKNCNTIIYEGKKLPKENHTWDGEWEIITEPSYNTETHETTDGTMKQTCSGGESTKTKPYLATEKIKQDLDSLCGQIRNLLNGSTEYSDETKNALEQANAKAAAITDVTTANQNEAMDAIAAMITAADAKNLITKSEYETKENEFNNLYNSFKTEIENNSSLYTETSIQEVQGVLTQIDKMEKDENGKLKYADLLHAIDLLNSVSLVTKDEEAEKTACEQLILDLKNVLTDDLKAIAEAGQKNYTDATWIPFKNAYDAVNGKSDEELMALGSGKLRELLNNLKTQLTEKQNTQKESGIKDGQIFTIASGTYQVISAKDKTVIITKGIDAKTVKVGPSVVINNEICRVVGIGKQAFTGLKNVKKVIIDANVETIGEQAFAKCKKLTNITIGIDVKSIGKKAFFNCPKLKKVILKGKALNNKGIGGNSFKKTAKKSTVKWPKGLKAKEKNKLKKAFKKAGLKVK